MYSLFLSHPTYIINGKFSEYERKITLFLVINIFIIPKQIGQLCAAYY